MYENEKRERVVKASRDITMNSKKVIFQVHRLSKDNKEEVLEKAWKDLEAVREQHFARLMKELQGTDFWKLRRAYSQGSVQEYVEAATFYKFCVFGTLSTLDEINSTLLPLSDPSLEPLHINILDYILGLADLTGELMRMAIGSLSDGEVEFKQRICQFVRQIHRELLLVVPQMNDSYDMKSKMEVMLQTCFSVHVRGSEYIPLLGDDAEDVPERAMTMTTESSVKDAFSLYADYLNNFNEKRERVVKASRDITMNSKKVIFQVHRLSKDNKEEVLEKAWKDLEAVREQHFARLMKELQGTDFWKLRRAYSPGVQEYVEAATFYKFCVFGTLSTLDEINSTLLPLSDPSLEPLHINILDYILGLADLTGELMRMAIGSLSDGEVEFAQRICQFVRQIHRELLLVVPQMNDSYDMKSKMEVMLQTCFSVHVRGSEYIPLLGDDAPTSFLLGGADVE
ncbi:hypothetical protein Bca52824_057356 [Brassica carinata]|uniref:Translin-associated protein X n=1 Tax=Brassica carinata TaxID=52824 RepID=A0A8X7UEQ6_BRACI|nr:hypothetical protein Bca52824_057356 [Brassica carinata]